MTHFPRIETPRLILSAPQAADLPQIVQQASNRNVSIYTMSLPHPYTAADAQGLINQAYQSFYLQAASSLPRKMQKPRKRGYTKHHPNDHKK